jgi:hypothetical protein
LPHPYGSDARTTVRERNGTRNENDKANKPDFDANELRVCHAKGENLASG